MSKRILYHSISLVEIFFKTKCVFDYAINNLSSETKSRTTIMFFIFSLTHNFILTIETKTGGSIVSKTHTGVAVGFIEFPVSLWHIFFYTRPGWKDTKRSLADSLVNFVSMDKATVCLQYCSLYQIRDQVVPLCWHAHNRCWWIEGALSSIFRSPWWKKRNELCAMKLHVSRSNEFYCVF